MSASPSHELRILFVENDSVFAQVVVREFLADHSVKTVGSVTAALESARAATFDAVLVDYDLDDGKGPAVVEQLRARGFPGLIVAVSSHRRGNEALRAAGADSVCSKMNFERIGSILLGKAGER